ncbi:MAG: hypothetical protein CVV28_05435 [Methanobacteriales archaeon HGW-Methanobacteriales-1]|nr:MAG: hypothetical protein CVV28_05435 [Methanobacteriales archaeon HGW-Methanobacteriales-1]
MWLPTEDPKTMEYGNLDKSDLPEFGYIKILNRDNEAVIFVKESFIVGSWCMEVSSLEEFHENKAMKRIDIANDSKLEIYETNNSLFETLIELNEECKLSLPIEIKLILNERVSDISSRKDLLEKYRIRAPSEEDVENLLLNYKS